MNRKAMILTVVFIYLIVFTPFAYSQTEAITAGLHWLNISQNQDGGWDSLTATTTGYFATASVLNSFEALNVTSQQYTSGLAWLQNQSFDTMSTTYLAPEISVLANAGISISSNVNALLSYRNLDSGWGGYIKYSSTTFHTAFALQALKAAKYSDTAILYQAINFLIINQNNDGGWGFRSASGAISADSSNAYVTALVLRALSSYNSLFLLQNPINKASSYLLSKQNIDGCFDSSPSNVYETALSVMSLIESGNVNTQAILNGLNYLNSTQLDDGSWNDDPYSTALALQALAAARPNLTVSTITESKPMPREGEETTITATVKNSGFDTASSIIARLYLGDPSTGGVQIGTDQLIPSLTPNASTPISVTAAFTGTGNKTIFVVVDPDNLISETSKSDNKISTRIWVATAPDLAIFSEDLKPSTYTPSSGTAFTLEYKVRNLGESAADAFTVSLYDGDPSTNSGHLLTTANVSGLLGMESRSLSFGVTLSGRGAHTLYLMADSGNQIVELSETNNTGTVTIQVDGAQGMADLVITSSDITLTPSRPHAGDSVQISAKVRNQGTEAASTFTVEIFDGAPESGGTLIRSQIVSIASGTNQTISANWTITSGIHDIYVIADRMNSIVESDENNNVAFTRIMADMVDISISATDLVFTPSHPVNNDTVVLSITAHNTGIKQTGAFNLALYDGDPAAGGALLQTFPINNIAADNKSTVSYTFFAIPWTYRFYVIADTENVVTEMYEDNNLAIRSLKVKAPGEILGPDLVPISIDLTSVATDPLTLAISGKAHVNFQNKGDDKITSSFNVVLFEDTDLDGRYTPGLDNILSSGIGTRAIFDEGSFPESVLLITAAYSPALYIEGSVYLIEHDGKIKWGPVYLKDLSPDFRTITYANADIMANHDIDGEPLIIIRIHNKALALDKDGYLKQSQPSDKQ